MSGGCLDVSEGCVGAVLGDELVPVCVEPMVVGTTGDSRVARLSDEG